MRYSTLLTLAVALVGAAPFRGVRAQRPTPDTAVVHVTAGAIDSAFRDVAAAPPEARDLPTGALAHYQAIVLSRRTASEAEVHERWTDVVFVKRGAAVLRTGRALFRRRAGDPGEWSGSAVARPRDQLVGPGDVLVIPAGIAHQWRPSGPEPFSYVLVKVRPGGRAVSR